MVTVRGAPNLGSSMLQRPMNETNGLKDDGHLVPFPAEAWMFSAEGRQHCGEGPHRRQTHQTLGMCVRQEQLRALYNISAEDDLCVSFECHAPPQFAAAPLARAAGVQLQPTLMSHHDDDACAA